MNGTTGVKAPHISADGNVLALDGGFGSLLEHLGYSVNNHELWSGGANIDDPDLVLRAHKLFIEAGADVIMTNTYHCSIQKMIDVKGYTLEQAEDVLKRAVEIAKRAVRESQLPNREVTLVGAIGPYATYLRDASEYSGSYTKKPEFQKQTIVDYYRQQAKPLLEAGIECLVFETIPTLVEVDCLRFVMDSILKDYPRIRAWIVSTCENDTETRSGDLFAEVARTAASIPAVECVGVNCTAPGHVTSLLESAKKALVDSPTKPAFVVYPNSGEVYNTAVRRFEGEARIDEIVAQVPRWRALGARVIGGCCRVLPPEIRAIADACHLENLENVSNKN